MTTIYEKQYRRKKLCELGPKFTKAFYNFIPDFIDDNAFFDVRKFKEKVVGLSDKDDLIEYIDNRYNKDTLKLIKTILAYNDKKYLL